MISRPSQALIRVRTGLYKTLKYGELGARNAPAKLLTSYNRRGLDIWRKNLRLFRQAAEALEVDLFVAKQPTLITPGLAPEEKKRCRVDFHGFDFDSPVERLESRVAME